LVKEGRRGREGGEEVEGGEEESAGLVRKDWLGRQEMSKERLEAMLAVVGDETGR
jgi:hypothetical protein